MQKASKNFILNLKKQKRENKSLLFLDNIKIIKDALSKGTIQMQCLLTSLSENEFLALEFNHANSAEIYQVEDHVIQTLADTKTPQKVLCIAYHHQDVVQIPKTNFLVLDGLQDPGNVGTLIRTAKASGFEFVFLVDSVKKTNSKLVRSSVGAVFDNQVFELSKADFIAFAKKNDLHLLCTDMNGENIFDFAQKMDNENTSQTVGIVIGNEGQGVSQEIRHLCKKTISIPMRKGIESLNAGVSGAIIMYEINKNKFKK